VDVLRSRLIVSTTAVEVHGRVTFGHEPTTKRSKRTVPIARSVMRRVEDHLATWVGAQSESIVFTARRGGPLFRSTFAREVWRPAVARAGLEGFTFHGLRHSFLAILVAAGCNVREVSEWAGHNSVAFTLVACHVHGTALIGFLPASWGHPVCQSWDHPARLAGESRSRSLTAHVMTNDVEVSGDGIQGGQCG
jgi:site-specific recombinase XerD